VRPLQRGGGVQHCHGRGRPGQVHPGRPVHVQPVPRTVFVGTVRRSSSGRSKPSAGAIARPTFFEHLNGGRTCESAMPAFRGQAESGAAPLAAAASTWPLVLSNSTNAPSLARLANAARIAVSTVGPYCRHGLALVEACAIRARPPITASARVVLERVALSLSPVRRVRYDTDDRPATGPSGRARGSAGSSVASRPRRSSSSSSCSIRRINVSSIEEAI
jgi:hypothetical protein